MKVFWQRKYNPSAECLAKTAGFDNLEQMVLQTPRVVSTETTPAAFFTMGFSSLRLVFDPTYPNVDETKFYKCNWKHFYGDVKEAKPLDAPEPRGKEVDTSLYVDSDHAGDKRVRCSRTGYFIFLNLAPVMWLSKRQSTIETSVFGVEFVAMKTCALGPCGHNCHQTTS